MKLWSVAEVGEFLGVPPTWIYDRTRDRGPETIPHIKLGKYVRFNPDSPEFQRWLLSHVVGSDTQQGGQVVEMKRVK